MRRRSPEAELQYQTVSAAVLTYLKDPTGPRTYTEMQRLFAPDSEGRWFECALKRMRIAKLITHKHRQWFLAGTEPKDLRGESVEKKRNTTAAQNICMR